MAQSFDVGTGNGVTTNWSLSFPYLNKDHVKVLVDGVETAFTWVNASTVSVVPAPANGTSVMRKRETPRVSPYHTLSNQTIDSAESYNEIALQLLYSTQEQEDALSAAQDALEATEGLLADATEARDDAAAAAAAAAASAVDAEAAATQAPIDAAAAANAVLASKQSISAKGAAGGYAGLDGTGKVPLRSSPLSGAVPQLKKASDFGAEVSAADFIVTGAADNSDEHSLRVFKKVVSSTAPAYFRKTDASGNIYEDLNRNRIKAERSLEIYGVSGVDVKANLEDGINWLGDKGGGTIDLPDGVVEVNSGQMVIDRSGVGLRGLGTDLAAARGTRLALVSNHAGPKVLIGNSTGTRRYGISIDNMQISSFNGSGDAAAFRSLYVQDLFVSRIRGQGAKKWFTLGDPNNAAYMTVDAHFEDMVLGMGNQVGILHESAFDIPNSEGGIYFNKVWGQGPSAPLSGTAFLRIPSTALRRPDGIYAVYSGGAGYNRGYDLLGGFGNFHNFGCRLDNMEIASVYLVPNNDVDMFEWLGGTMVGDRGLVGLNANAVGVYIQENGGTIRKVNLIAPTIKNFGKHAIQVVSGNQIKIVTPTIRDCATQANNTNAAIRVQSTAGIVTIIQPDITDGDYVGGNKPKYGIEVLETGTKTTIIAPNTSQWGYGSAAISDANNNRKYAGDKRVFTFYRVDPAASLTDSAVLGNGVMNFLTLPRAARIRTIKVQSSAALSGGSAALKILIGGVLKQTVTLNNGDLQAVAHSTDDTVYAALQTISCTITTTGAYAPTTNDITVEVEFEFTGA